MGFSPTNERLKIINLKKRKMSTLNAFVQCKAIQTDLVTAWVYNNNTVDAPVLRTILSDLNRRDFIQKSMKMRSGGLVEVEVVYDQQFLESDVEDGARTTCDADGTDGTTSTIYTLDPSDGNNMSKKFTLSELQNQCESSKDFIAREVKKMMDAILKKMDTSVLTKLYAAAGNFAYDVDLGNAAGTTDTFVTTTRTSTGILVPNAYQDVRFHFNQNGFTGVPFGFGGKIWQDYALLTKAACCNDLGIDVNTYASTSSFGFEYTNKFHNVFANDNDAVFMALGTAQLITFNEFDNLDGSNAFAVNDDSLIMGTLYHPDADFPVKFDYKAELVCESGNEKAWKLSIGIAHDLITMPTDMYRVGDRMFGVNGINKFRITNP